MFQDRQIDPLKGRLLHADLSRLTKGEKLELTIAIHLIGEPVGVKNDGEMLDQQLREIKVLCLATAIPESIDIDVSELEVGQSIHVSDLKFSEGVEVNEDPEILVASVVLVKEEVEEPVVGETETVVEESTDQE